MASNSVSLKNRQILARKTILGEPRLHWIFIYSLWACLSYFCAGAWRYLLWVWLARPFFVHENLTVKSYSIELLYSPIRRTKTIYISQNVKNSNIQCFYFYGGRKSLEPNTRNENGSTESRPPIEALTWSFCFFNKRGRHSVT